MLCLVKIFFRTAAVEVVLTCRYFCSTLSVGLLLIVGVSVYIFLLVVVSCFKVRLLFMAHYCRSLS